MTELFSSDDADAEERQERRGTWKRADMLKMHDYRDAIRRTQGAYILYPGNDAPACFACGTDDGKAKTMTALTTSMKHFASLNLASGPTWTDATKRKAPHKPLLLLAVLNLVHRGVILTIHISGGLVKLKELFNLYRWRIIPLGYQACTSPVLGLRAISR